MRDDRPSRDAGPEWVRHSDYYVAVGETPGLPRTQPNAHEVRSQHWGRLRRLPSQLLGALLKGYRRVISPLYGQVCSYYPSCSAYGLEAVTVHGAVRGSLLTAWRILRCNPFTGGGVDHVPVGRRIWPRGSAPSIIETNHPPIPLDHDCADDGRAPSDAEAPASQGEGVHPADSGQR
ncbi:membrane protein insertion efficiency factor YidD [Actinocorallia glomerata]|uniref:Putative membrane protein insertion efficiency factor n=2 Tax=Actinomycetes TaxID=1760 RepID=A0ABP6LSV4_9MICC